MIIMALDLASTSGWAVGEPGGIPAHGSHRFASAGASHEAIFAAALKWTSDKITNYAASLIVWEAPLASLLAARQTLLWRKGFHRFRSMQGLALAARATPR
jgi:hypothetical protein